MKSQGEGTSCEKDHLTGIHPEDPQIGTPRKEEFPEEATHPQDMDPLEEETVMEEEMVMTVVTIQKVMSPPAQEGDPRTSVRRTWLPSSPPWPNISTKWANINNN